MIPNNILLLYKTSIYEYHGHAQMTQQLDPDHLRCFQRTHQAHYDTVNTVESVLSDRHLRYQKAARGTIDDYRAFDMVIAVGGDGTFLEAARYSQDQVILGVNSDPSWSVGCLCHSTGTTFARDMDQILNGEKSVCTLNRLMLTVDNTQSTVCFLNDVLIAHANPASLSRYVLCIDQDCEEQRGSGIWISTATGSSGAIYSAGGTVMSPQSMDIQYRPRELYQRWKHQPYRLRGGIVAADTAIRITSLMAEGMIFFDGSHQRVALGVSQSAVISQSETPLRVI